MRDLAPEQLVLVTGVLLAAVFGLAGVSKLLDIRGSRAAARSFGVPGRLTGLVGLGLPVAEIAIAI